MYFHRGCNRYDAFLMRIRSRFLGGVLLRLIRGL